MTTSVELRQSAFAADTEDVWLLLLTLTHPDLQEPIRIVNDVSEITSNGNRFFPFGFDFEFPFDAPDRAPEARISIDNVSLELIETIRSISSPPTVRMDFIRAAAPDVLELTLDGFRLRDTTWDSDRISGVLAQEDIITEGYPADAFTPASFRGLV